MIALPTPWFSGVRIPGLRRLAPSTPGVSLLDRRKRTPGEKAVLGLLVLWSLTMVLLLNSLILVLSSRDVLLGLPLLAAVWLAVSGYVVRRLGDRERLRLDANGLEYLRVDAWGRSRRTIPLAEVRRLTIYNRVIDGPDHWQPHVEYGLAIETIGRTLCVGQSGDRDSVERLRHEVEWHLQDSCPAWVNAPECSECEVIDLTTTPAEPPSDGSLTCRRERDRTEFSVPLREDRPAGLIPVMAALLYFSLIVIPLSDRGPFNPGAGLFLLAMTGALGLAYSIRRVWIVRPGELVTSLRFADLGWSCTTEIERLERMELRRVPSRTPWDARFKLVLIDGEGEECEAIGPLTEGEAGWMAGIVAEILSDALTWSGRDVRRPGIRPGSLTAGSLAMADPWIDAGLYATRPDRTPRSGVR
jgi:hypothetical protein